jgi:hypothetical protein
VVASSIAFNMETVNGLEVDGGLGEDSLTIRDENNPYELPGGSDFLVTPGSVRRYAEHPLFDNAVVPVEVGFEWVENVTVVAGDQADEFVVEGELAIGNTSLTLDGNSGGDLFRVRGPAFGEMHIQGDAPIFSPGDRLVVNEDGMYAVGAIPGLYPQGAGGQTIGDMTIQYTGIESATVQEQIYGGPGDFDLNGLVNAEDLTHPTLGWNVRFDLNGHDLLIWQQNFGANRLLARGGILAGGGGLSAGDQPLDAPSADSRLATESTALAALYAFETFQQQDDQPVLYLDSSQNYASTVVTPTTQGAPSRPTTRNVATVDLGLERYIASGEDDDAVADASWDEAFAAWGSAVLAAV